MRTKTMVEIPTYKVSLITHFVSKIIYLLYPSNLLWVGIARTSLPNQLGSLTHLRLTCETKGDIPQSRTGISLRLPRLYPLIIF